MQKLGHIHVISCGVEGTLSKKALELLSQAQVVFASKALVSLYGACIDSSVQEVHTIAAKAREDAKCALQACKQGKCVVVLASGDALYNGMGGTLLDVYYHDCPHDFAPMPMTFHPHITAFQALFHTLALPWQGVALFSVHAKATLPLQSIVSAPFAAIYGGTQFPASHIAKALMEFHAPSKDALAIMAQCLGSEEEKIHVGTLQTLAALPCHATSVLLTLPSSHYAYVQDRMMESAVKSPTVKDPIVAPLLPLGLEENFYERENNLITASDVRAVILARLRVPRWGVLWDLGAGSGSVGLEAAALCPHLQVLGVEQKARRLSQIQANARKLGVDNYTLVHAHALELLQSLAADHDAEKHGAEKHSAEKYGVDASLAQPDRIFIGGGGADIVPIIELALQQLRPQGLLVVSAVSLESFHAISHCAKKHGAHLSSIQMAHEQCIAGQYHHLKNQNTIYIFTFCQEKCHV